MSLKGKAAIVGYAATKPVRHGEGLAIRDIMAKTAIRAVEDAGLKKGDIDGLVSSASGPEMSNWTAVLAEYLGIHPKMASVPSVMGATGAGGVWRAASAIDSGLCDCVLCVGGQVEETATAVRQARSAAEPPRAPQGSRNEFDAPYGPMGEPSNYALVAQRHGYEFGTTDLQRARVAVDQRTNACHNPQAIFYGQPITVEDVINSRIISSPLHLLECVMPAQASVAYIVTSAERAKDLRRPPVYILGAGEGVTHWTISSSPNMTTSAGSISSKTAFKMAGVTPKDMNMASVYDCFTITVMITLEDSGFMKKGESGAFYEKTDTTYKGKFPVNTHGGQLSWGQPTGTAAGGMSHVMDAVEQLMGRAGERQVPNCKLAFVEGNGGTMSYHVSLILGREKS